MVAAPLLCCLLIFSPPQLQHLISNTKRQHAGHLPHPSHKITEKNMRLKICKKLTESPREEEVGYENPQRRVLLQTRTGALLFGKGQKPVFKTGFPAPRLPLPLSQLASLDWESHSVKEQTFDLIYEPPTHGYRSFFVDSCSLRLSHGLPTAYSLTFTLQLSTRQPLSSKTVFNIIRRTNAHSILPAIWKRHDVTAQKSSSTL
ncbi:hypothetical protein QBC36DRAFT_97049 [Triangularia setosa]|uniref:Uncharacterized protein n=1 Tax=Triangularia setosa TaxID=2587417 RepID=A0AAN7AAH0_9PEZI|nr:hypothetical protein QBC36DRAFT_97049 [Podospora setosa]